MLRSRCVLRICVLGERDPSNATHVATDEAIAHSSAVAGTGVMASWVATDEVAGHAPEALAGFDGLLVAPGSPYRSIDGALEAIRVARSSGLPTLGTCAGFQHMVLEVARNVLGLEDAEHAEYEPGGGQAVIVPISCSVTGQTLPVKLVPGTRLATAYGTDRAEESYYCNFEVNPEYVAPLASVGLRVSAIGPAGEARAAELDGHPFFVGTLYVPQTASTLAQPHPVVTAWLRASRERSSRL